MTSTYDHGMGRLMAEFETLNTILHAADRALQVVKAQVEPDVAARLLAEQDRLWDIIWATLKIAAEVREPEPSSPSDHV